MAIVTSQVAAVQKLYVAYFNRPADYAGLDYWTNVVANNKGDTAAVSAAFAAEAEYKTEYANMNNADIVNKIYLNLFGRPAEDAGKAYWAGLLDKKTMTIDEAVAKIAAAAGTTDAEAYENKVAGASAFTAALDTAAEQKAYSGAAANSAAKTFLTSITTDASLTAAIAPAALTASVAKVVAAGTPFTLAGALGGVLAAQEAKSDVVQGLADNEAVAKVLGNNNKPTDAQILTAINTVSTDAKAAANLAVNVNFSTSSDAMQTAMISDQTTALNKTLKDANTALDKAEEAVEKVAGLGKAFAAYQNAAEEAAAATKAAGLALNAQTAALSNFETLAGDEVVFTEEVSVTLDGDIVIEWDDDEEEYVLADGVVEKDAEGVTAALKALNANLAAQAAADDADVAKDEAATAADILDASDDGSLLADVAEAMKFTALDEDEVPTYEMILTEQAIFDDKIDALDAVAGGDGAYETAMNTLAAAVTGAADATAVKALTDPAVANGYITAADAANIKTAFIANAATADDAVLANSWLGRATAFEDAVDALLLAEEEASEAGIGGLTDELETQQQAVEDAQDDIDAMNAAVTAFNNAKALLASVKAADDAISTATKVLTNEGFAAPVALNSSIVLSTAKDDIFLVGSQDDVSLRSFGVLGQDTLYVGTTLKYNDKAIGSGTGETALKDAGDDAVLEFFLEETATGVNVIIENKNYGSESANDADTNVITLVGVDLGDITVSNGFITVGTPPAA